MKNEQERRRLIERWRASGETAAVFGKRHGLTAKQLHMWVYRMGLAARPRKATTIERAGTQAVRLVRLVPRPEIARAAQDRPIGTGVRISIAGAIVDVALGFDEVSLQRVIAALRTGTRGTA